MLLPLNKSGRSTSGVVAFKLLPKSGENKSFSMCSDSLAGGDCSALGSKSESSKNVAGSSFSTNAVSNGSTPLSSSKLKSSLLSTFFVKCGPHVGRGGGRFPTIKNIKADYYVFK